MKMEKGMMMKMDKKEHEKMMVKKGKGMKKKMKGKAKRKNPFKAAY